MKGCCFWGGLLFVAVVCVCVRDAEAFMADELPVLPLPLEAEFADRHFARTVSFAGAQSLVLNKPCAGNAECVGLLRDAFTRVVLGAAEAQTGLAPWLLSRHAEFALPPPPQPSPWLENLTRVTVAFEDASAELLPELSTLVPADERYTLAVGRTGAAEITARTAWGVLRAFETLAQLLGYTETGGLVLGRLPLRVRDEPRFAWRGLMVDVARHYMPVRRLQGILDAMAAFKLNVMHLHLSDSQSFPFVVEALPELQDSAFHPDAVYHHWDLAQLVAYARQRGITIVPEIDMPGHAASWRHIDADVIADCLAMLVHHDGYYENRVPLNPASNRTLPAITAIVTELARVFTTTGVVHVGGDEVQTACWDNCTQRDAIRAWMREHNLSSWTDVEHTLDLFAQNEVRSHGLAPMVWDEAFTNGHILDNNTIVHAWHSLDVLARAVRAGHRTVLSYGYYMDRQDPLCSGKCSGINWMFSRTYLEMYAIDPLRDTNLTADEAARILGGEATMFAESIDNANFDHMAFGRLGAFAERFWSPATATEPHYFERRAQQLRCLMVRRGISRAGPLSSDYCETHDIF